MTGRRSTIAGCVAGAASAIVGTRSPAGPMTRPTSIFPLLLAALLALAASLRPAAAFTPAEATAPMTVQLVRSDAPDCGADCPEWLALTGAIGPGTPALLLAALARLGDRRVPLLVDSPGGRVEAALAMGKAIRARRLDVAVAGTALTDCAPTDHACATRRRGGERPGYVAGGIAACASACVLVLAAGTDRAVGQDSYVGVHQMIVHRTFTRVINTFRVTRRLVGGRPVEVSRTLIATRPVSSRVVQSAAPEGLYSEVDRYLIAMGVAESIMPLMRATPSTGIHWMTPAEVAATRIATDTTDARTLVARAAERRAPAAPPALALAALTLKDGHRWMGIVDWRVDRAPAGGAPGPALVGTVDVPERHLHGTVSIRRSTDPGAAEGFALAADFGPGTGDGAVSDLLPPRLCDGTICYMPFTAAPPRDGEGSGHRFTVTRAWGDTFLSTLGDRDWLTFGVTAGDGRRGDVGLSLSLAARTAVGEWERLCCGLAPSAATTVSPPPLPAAAPAQRPPALAPQPSEARVAYRLQSLDGDATPLAGTATMAWIPLAAPDPPAAAGRASLIGTLEIPGGVRVSIQAGIAAPGDAGDVALDLSLVPAPDRFGPLGALSIPPVWGPDGHVVIGGERRPPARSDGSCGAALTLAADTIPDGAELILELDDRAGRRLTLTLPVDGPLRALLGTGRNARGATG